MRERSPVHLGLLVCVIGACATIPPANVPCTSDGDCDLAVGGGCLAAPSGNRWCSYLDPSCASGRQWSNVDTGDDLGGTCVPDVPPDPYVGGYVFVSDRDGNNEIYLMAADGSQQIAITQDPGEDLDPMWSPDGQHIAFRSSRNGVIELFVMTPDGGGVTDLSHGEAAWARWSPDGAHLAFVSRRSGQPELYVTALDGSEPRQLTSDGGSAPAWSPDGRRLVYVHDNNLVIISADGSTRRVLTNGHSDEPVWDPTGERIAYTRFEVDSSVVFVMSAIGGAPVPVTTTPGGFMHLPAWSPDGSRLAYLVDDGTDVRVWAMELGAPPAPVEVVAEPTPPMWACDGAAIISSQRSATDLDVVRVTIGLGDVTNLSHHAGADRGAAMRP